VRVLVAYLAGYSADLEERSLRAGGGASTRRSNLPSRWPSLAASSGGSAASGLLAAGA